MSNKKNEESWDRLSEFYQTHKKISLEDFHYGPYGPGEQELRVIGDVKGLDILELGCGGGQNSIVLVKWGAKSVTAIDQSEKQLEYAKKLASSQGVKIKFLKGNIEDLSMLKDASFDLIVSSHAMNYVENLPRVFSEVARVLRENGRIVTCMGHPIMHLIWEALEKGSIEEVNNYFDDKRIVFDWADEKGEKIATFEETGYRFEEIINGLIFAGLKIERVLEPPGYSEAEIEKLGEDQVPYQDTNYANNNIHQFIAINQKVPFSLIVSAIKSL